MRIGKGSSVKLDGAGEEDGIGKDSPVELDGVVK